MELKLEGNEEIIRLNALNSIPVLFLNIPLLPFIFFC